MAELVVLVAGNMCAGKSTVIDSIEENTEKISKELDLPVRTYSEFLDPVSRNNFYLDRKKHTRAMEFGTLIGRKSRHEDIKMFQGVAFVDRGMIEGAETFAWNSYREGFFWKKHYDDYLEELYDNLDELDRTEARTWLESLIVYQEVQETSKLKERNDKRAKELGVEQVPYEYLDTMNRRYDYFMDNLKSIYGTKYAVPTPQLLKIDASIDMKQNPDFLQETVGLIIKKTKELLRK